MGYRLNERNSGNWSLDGEPKNVRPKVKKVTRSFSQSEIDMFNYLMDKIIHNISLDCSDIQNQVFKLCPNAGIEFSRDYIQDVRSLHTKFNQNQNTITIENHVH